MANLKPLPILHSKIDLQKHWFVLYCKPNTEKKTANALRERGFQIYCPVKTELRQWSDRKKKVEVPVLPSVILVRLLEKNRASVFQIPTALRYLYWLKKPAIVRDEEIEELKNILSGNKSQVSIEQMTKGDAIKLKGLGFDDEGAIIKYVTKSHYCIYLERLGYMIKVKR